MSLQSNQKGFTIVELLIVIVVIAILAAISIVAYTGIQERARKSSSVNLASQVAKKADAYYAINGTYPTTAAQFNNTTNKEPNLEGIRVTIGSARPGGVTTVDAAKFRPSSGATSQQNTDAAAALAQYNSGNRVIYVSNGSWYSVTNLGDAGPIEKGTLPTTGTYAWTSNEGAL